MRGVYSERCGSVRPAREGALDNPSPALCAGFVIRRPFAAAKAAATTIARDLNFLVAASAATNLVPTGYPAQSAGLRFFERAFARN